VCDTNPAEIQATESTAPILSIWILKIYDKKDLIFHISADDSFLDSFFNDHNFVQDCTSYLECKKKYYFHDLFKNMVVRSDLSQNPYAFSKDNNSSIHYVARDEIVKRFGLSDEESKKIIEKLINRLKGGEISLLYIPISPVQTMFPKVYVTELRSFITVYEW
jgi:hypothetical protein